MLSRPRLHSHLRAEIVDPETLLILGERTQHLLRGRIFCRLAPWLDGRTSLAEIARRLRGEASPLALWIALSRLQSLGYLGDGSTSGPAATEAFWSLMGAEGGAAMERLASRSVEVRAVGGLETSPLVAALSSLGIEAHDRPSEGSAESALLVVVTDDYLRPELRQLNRQALRSGKAWMLCKPVGATPWIGPILRPGLTGCWQCLAERLRRHRLSDSDDHRLAPPVAFVATSLQTATQLAATEIAKWLALRDRRSTTSDHGDGDPTSARDVVGCVATLDLDTLRLERHTLTRRPQCRACGSGGDPPEEPRPIELRSTPKRFTTDGGHRATHPTETLARLVHHVSPITGIVSRLERVAHDNGDPSPVYAAGMQRLGAAQSGLLRRGRMAASSGKGLTDPQARASALAEAIERHSGLFTGEDEICRRKSRHDLGDRALDPRRILQLSRDQYAFRDEWNRQHPDSSSWIPEPFDDRRAIDWTPLWSLTEQRARYLPTAMCYFAYPHSDGPQFAVADSNGNAAGNTLEEAVLQGLFELVERDSVAIWWYCRLRRPAFDLEGCGEPYVEELLHYYRAKDRDLWALDVTTDLGIPAFVALAQQKGTGPRRIPVGCGAHFDARLALLRALTECNQSFATPPEPAGESRARSRWLVADPDDHPYLTPERTVPARTLNDYPRQWSGDLRQDVLSCVELAARHGLETLVLDQTRPDIGMPVVKVVVPGLRHFWRRLAPGRLYEVPVHLGWLSEPLDEKRMNPLPFPS